MRIQHLHCLYRSMLSMYCKLVFVDHVTIPVTIVAAPTPIAKFQITKAVCPARREMFRESNLINFLLQQFRIILLQRGKIVHRLEGVDNFLFYVGANASHRFTQFQMHSFSTFMMWYQNRSYWYQFVVHQRFNSVCNGVVRMKYVVEAVRCRKFVV